MKRLKHWIKKHWADIVIDGLIGLFVIGLFTVGGVMLWVATIDIPDLSTFDQRRVLQSTKIYDRTGEVLLYDLHQDVKRTIVPMEEISHHIKNATVAIEDDQFYEHFGIDPRAIIRAALSNLTSGDLLGGQGGSTITQQVVKNAILEQDKLLTRKVKEVVLSIKLEQVLEKEEILWHYLNESPYGGTIYGIEEASQSYFGKSASDVTLVEAAYLAALPQAPSRLSPYGNNIDALERRKNLVLERMKVNGFISEDEFNAAMEERPEFQPQAITGIRAPHFVMYIREQLEEKFGEEALAEQGMRIITTLDWDLQKQAEEIVARKAAENTERFNASNAGLVAMNPQEGDILVMVGSRNYFDEEIDGNFNVALAPRQPGSSIKPYVYASAFSKGYLPETVVYDVRTQFSSSCEPNNFSNQNPCYSPNNYNAKFLGPISFRKALAQSLNIPAVKALYLTGLRDAIKLATDMGVTTLNDPDRLGLTLVLGGGEVKLLEHTGAYAVFANEGVRTKQRSILRIEDAAGRIIEETPVESERVLDRNVALMISDVLSDNIARAPLWGYNSLINFPNRDVAAKSGSTNNLRDAWIMGYAPNLAVGAWVGNNDNAAMGGGLSGLITTPMWREFMDVALETTPVETFPKPEYNYQGVKPILTGTVVDPTLILQEFNSSSTEVGSELGMANVLSGIHNILHFVIKDNPNGPYPNNPESDSQYENWEYAVQLWKLEQLNTLQLLQSNVVKPPEEENE